METTQQVFIVRANIGGYSAAIAAIAAIAARSAEPTDAAVVTAALAAFAATTAATAATAATAKHIDLTVAVIVILAVIVSGEDANMPTKIKAGPFINWNDWLDVCRSCWRTCHSRNRYRQS